MISSLIGDADLSGAKILAGRRFANKPSASRIASSPFSGLISLGSVSHLGPPTEPRRTASLALQAVSVSSGKGTPVASIAAPPKS